MNQILMNWNPNPADENAWEQIRSQMLSWWPSWQASSRTTGPSPEGDEEEIELPDDGQRQTPNSSWPEYFQGPLEHSREGTT